MKNKMKLSNHVFMTSPLCKAVMLFFLLWCSNVATASDIVLLARDAMLTGNLKLYDGGAREATIHKWSSTEDYISWTTTLEQGNYLVKLHYSEPYYGAAVSVEIGKRQLVSLLDSSGDWMKYRTSDLGVIHVEKAGEAILYLRGIQLALKDDIHQEALPDVHWLSLTPTEQESADNEIGISQNFKGHSLFDGKTLNGWEGNNGASSLEWFRVEDGAIVDGTMERNIPRNEFIRTERKYTDFEIRLKFRIKCPEGKGWNAGIQFRSKKNVDIPNEMVGYQADIIAKKWGGLYDEQRRWAFLGTWFAPKLARNEKDWNEYIIRCEGARIRTWLNGELTQDYIEPYAYTPHPKYGIIPMKGYIGLQIHERKNPFEAWYKDIEIQELKVKPRRCVGYKSYGRLAEGVATADSLGWKVGIQAYSVKKVATFFEAIDLSAAMGLKYIEGVNMRISSETDETFGPDMSDKWTEAVKQKLIDSGIECTSYYKRLKGATDPVGTEKTFRFCRQMGLMLVTDPERVSKGNGSMDFYENLAKKYNVRMVLTNHPREDNSPYWNPDIVLQDLEGRDKLLGASVDVGHFMRDGYAPLDIVEKYVKAGRMYHFHLRDVDGLGANARDIVIGRGVARIDRIFALLRENGVKPVVALEYERDLYNPMIDIIQSINGVEQICKDLK